MDLRRAAIVTACMLALSAGSAAAQWPAAQQSAPSGFGSAPPPAPSGFGPAPQPQSAAGGGFGPAPQAAPSFGPAQQPPSPMGFGGLPQQRQQQQSQQAPPCVQTFLKLRDDTQKKADSIRVASERKVPPQEACALFNAFSAAEMKMIKYAADNGKSCGIPDEFVVTMKKNHAKTTEIRARVCQVAAQPPAPAGPSLSDALTAPVPDTKNIKSGGGTFDTLSGTPLGRQ